MLAHPNHAMSSAWADPENLSRALSLKIGLISQQKCITTWLSCTIPWMSSAQYDEDRQLSTVMASELCLLSSKMQNTWPKKVCYTIHEYGVILYSIWTYQAILETTEHMSNAFHKIFPSFSYQATTPGPKSSRNTWGCHFHCLEQNQHEQRSC